MNNVEFLVLYDIPTLVGGQFERLVDNCQFFAITPENSIFLLDICYM